MVYLLCMNIKKILLLFLLMIISPKYILSQREAITPGRLIIVGSIIGGIEIINGILQLFGKGEESAETNLTPEKKREIEKLLSRSRLLEVLSQEKSPIVYSSIETNIIVTTKTQIALKSEEETNIIAKPEEETEPQPEKLGVIPSEEKEYFTYKITSYTYKTVKKLKRGVVDYYEVGVAYYKVGKKRKAREYLLHTIAINVRKEEAIEFLIQHYNMTRKEIQIEKKKYKYLEK